MAGSPSIKKREKERARLERQAEKAARKKERREVRGPLDRTGEEDPDLAGIVPGPQPPAE